MANTCCSYSFLKISYPNSDLCCVPGLMSRGWRSCRKQQRALGLQCCSSFGAFFSWFSTWYLALSVVVLEPDALWIGKCGNSVWIPVVPTKTGMFYLRTARTMALELTVTQTVVDNEDFVIEMLDCLSWKSPLKSIWSNSPVLNMDAYS